MPKPRCSVTAAIAETGISGSLTGTCTACSSAVAGEPFVDVVDAQHVGEEQRVELSALQHAGEIGPVVQRVVAVGAIVGMGPQSGGLMADAAHVEGVEADLLWHWLDLVFSHNVA